MERRTARGAAFRPRASGPALAATLGLGLGTWLGLAPKTRADFPGARELAEAMVESATPRWTGARVPAPPPADRPDAVHRTVVAPLRPLAVHATTPDVGPARAASFLDALEIAHVAFEADGWTLPPDDGGRGGDHGFDLYLVPGVPAEGRTDARHDPSFLDRATTHAVVDPGVPPGRLLACVSEAYASALLLALDPAEAVGWRQATAAWLAHRVSGRYGCDDDDPVARQQAHPDRPWIDDDGPEVIGPRAIPDGGALLLALFADRLDGGDGRYVRQLWDAARQLTWEGDQLRGWPDLWHATEATVEAAGLRLPQVLTAFATERWFAGRPGRSTLPTVEALGTDARVSPHGTYRYAGRAFEVPPPLPGLHPHGSVYILLDVEAAPRDAPAGLWLRGEVGVDWTMTALRLDEGGTAVSRMTAPARREPRAYLPVVLDPQIRWLLVVVTNLGAGLPDPTGTYEALVRSFALRVGRGR